MIEIELMDRLKRLKQLHRRTLIGDRTLILLNVRGLINVLGKPIVPVWLTFAASVFKCYSAKNNYFLAQHKHTQATESRERSYWYDWCWFGSALLAYRTSMITPVHCSKTHASASHPTHPSPQVPWILGTPAEQPKNFTTSKKAHRRSRRKSFRNKDWTRQTEDSRGVDLGIDEMQTKSNRTSMITSQWDANAK